MALCLKTSLLVLGIQDWISGPLKSDTVSSRARHCGSISSELCRPGAKPWRMGPATRNALRRNTTSIKEDLMQIEIIITNFKRFFAIQEPC